jgi:hypothetical protein
MWKVASASVEIVSIVEKTWSMVGALTGHAH